MGKTNNTPGQTKKILITGGGGGIAREIARKLDRPGNRLILVDISEEKAAQIERHIAINLSGAIKLTDGIAPLNFMGKVRSAEEVARAVLKGIKTGRMEIYVPYSDSLTSRLVGYFPWLLKMLEPALFRLGERGHKKYNKQAGLTSQSSAGDLREVKS